MPLVLSGRPPAGLAEVSWVDAEVAASDLAAVGALEARLAGDAPASRVLPTHLVVRDST